MPRADWQAMPEDQAGTLLERVYLIEEAAKTIDELYASFLKIRFSKDWEEKEKPLLARWVSREGV